MPSIPTPGSRQIRLELSKRDYAELRILRAKADLPNAALLSDMMRVYKKHPGDWVSAKKK